MKYEMTVTQTLSKDIPVIADNEQEAFEKAHHLVETDDFDFMTDNDTEIDTSVKMKEKNYSFSVEEILTKFVTVTAKSREEAQDKIEHLYDSAEIVLNYKDHSETLFNFIESD